VAVLAAGAGRADEMPPILREVKLEQRLDNQVPLGLTFRAEDGRPVTLGECVEGKPTVLVLAYYRCPRLCTQVLNGLVKGLRGVPFSAGREFNVVVVSFDDREKPELAAAKKAAYVEDYGRPGAEAGWHFLTGEQVPILRLANAVGFQFRYDPKHDQFAHPSCVTLLTPTGKVSRYFLGLDYRPLDLRLGLVEASENKIGSPVDQVILFCYHYDPETGKYTAVAMNLVRAGGAVTVLVMATALGLAWRRDWRKGRAPSHPTGPDHVR
jgi:protein SCO1/2